jgi:hypothetical protein
MCAHRDRRVKPGHSTADSLMYVSVPVKHSIDHVVDYSLKRWSALQIG